MKQVELQDITNNLDRRRIPLNSSQRAEKESNPLYPYIGANNIMGYIDEYIFDEKILCIAEDGGSWGYQETCAKIYNEKVWVNNHAHVLTAKKNLVLEYLMYYLNYADLSLYINGATRGKLTKTSLNSIQIPLPPLPVQKKIAAILDAADAYRQKTKALIEKYDELAQSLFLDMFGDLTHNVKYPITTVGDLTVAVKDGPHVSPKYSEDGIPILSTRNIRPNQLIMDDMKYVSSVTFQELTRRFQPQKDDILLTKGGTTGFAKHVDWDWDFCIWVHLAALRPNLSLVSPKYLEAALNSHYCYQQSQKYTRGIANKDLGLTRMVNIKLPFPPLEIQEQFTCKVQCIDQMKSSAIDSMKKAEELFQSLLQKAFKGNLI